MKKQSSILDYSYPFLDPAVWDHDRKLHTYQKDFILRLINTMYETYGLVETELWVTDIIIIGSLTTSKWLLTSDLDVHIRVNLAAFQASNLPQGTLDEAFAKLDAIRLEFDRAKILAPMTQHPAEFYFEAPDYKPSNLSLVGVYSIPKDTWLQEPIIFDADLDFEESKRDVIAQAEALAEQLDSTFGKIDREIDRVGELENVIKAWDKSKQQLFYNKVQQKLQNIEAEILKTLQLKQDLVDARHAGQDAMSEVEVKFKWLQRFGFFGILNNLKILLEQTGGQVTTQELPLIKKIINESSLKEASYGQAYWVDPNGKVFEVRDENGLSTHYDWIFQNLKLLEDQYGLVQTDRRSLSSRELIKKGWIRIGDSPNNDWSVQVNDLSNIPVTVDQLLSQFVRDEQQILVENIAENRSVVITWPVKSIQQAVNKAIRLPMAASLKEAFLKEAFEEPNEADTDIYVDFDKTIATGDKYPKIGKPIEGAKEGLQKIKDLGYNIVIYTCRGNSEEGIDTVTKWLDEHDMLYDSIFSGEKPFYKHVIDDKAIHFDTWSNALEQVEKSDKKASLVIAKLNQKYWLDPSGKEYPVEHMLGHLGWLPRNREILNNQYGISTKVKDPTDPTPVADDMIAKGWTRITTESDYDFAMEIADLNRIPAYLDNFVAQHYTGGGVEIDDLTGDYQDLSDPFPSLEKAIRQAKRIRQQPVAASLKQAKTKKVKQGQYSCIMAMIPHEIAQEIVEFGVREIPDEDLYLDEDGNLGRELQAHVTIEYGLLTDDAKSVRRSFNNQKPFKVKLGKVRHFQPPEREFDVVTVEVVSDDLKEANKMIVDSFECADDLPSSGEYKPHITVAYVKRNAAKKHIGSDEFEGKEVELDTLVFSPRKGNKTFFSISQDKESSFLLEKINKIANADFGYWIDPKGNAYGSEGNTHFEWTLANLDLLEKNYGIKFSPELKNEAKEYFDAISEGGTNFDPPGDNGIWQQMLQSGWVRVGDAGSDAKVMVELNDFRNIPSFVDGLIAEDLYDGDLVEVEDINNKIVYVEYPWKSLQQAVNRALSGQPKQADFLPSLALNTPDNDWQFAEGGDNLEIPLDPDAVSDESTYYAPCTVGKPRSKDVWRQFISMFSKAFSKKEQVKLSYDKDLEDVEKNELGEDQTLLEYSKGFKDLNRLNTNKPKTTWDSPYQDLEPSKPLPVTYSPQISNEDNLDQNSPGGYPRRFMGKPKGEWTSNEGEVNKTLIDMLKNREAALNTMTVEITSIQKNYALYVGGRLAIRTLTRAKAVKICRERFPNEFASGNYEIKEEDFKTSSLNKAAGNVINLTNEIGNIFYVYKNPSKQQILELYDKSGGEIRFIQTRNEFFMWDANFATHPEVGNELGIEFPGDVIQADQIESPGEFTHFLNSFSSKKQAGSQSASVPDYLIDEWKTEQIHDDVDSEPYVNHQERDYPYGFQDAPQNTANDFPWAKDISRAVVHLDTLENPAYRLDPLGIGEYNVTYYLGMPMSDGMEV